MLSKNLVRVRRSHLFDVHAASRARDNDGSRCGSVEDDAQIQLAIDLQPFFDQHSADLLPLRAGLMGDQRHPDHLFGDLLGLLWRSDDFHASALATAASVNLRLDHRDVAAEPTSDVTRFRGGECHFTARDRDAESGEDLFCLVLVDFHKRLIVSNYDSVMIVHIVFWRLHQTANGKSKHDNAREIKERLEALRGLPGCAVWT